MKLQGFDALQKRLQDISEQAQEASNNPTATKLKIDLEKWGPSDAAGREAFGRAIEAYLQDRQSDDANESNRQAAAKSCLAAQGLPTSHSDNLEQAIGEAVASAVKAKLGL